MTAPHLNLALLTTGATVECHGGMATHTPRFQRVLEPFPQQDSNKPRPLPMRTRKSHVNIINPFKSLDEIVRATGRSWRTVRKRLEEAKCYPLFDMERGDVLILLDDTPPPVYTEAEQAQQMVRWEALRDKLMAEGSL